MTRFAPIALIVGTAASLASPSVTPQSKKPPRDVRVAIVAYHDSRLLTLCPVVGKDVIESSIWTSRMQVKSTVFYPPTGGQRITFQVDHERAASVILPLPGEGTQADLDRLARDIGVERRLADEFRARKVYSVVDSPADADFVVVAESTYLAMAAGTADRPPQGANDGVGAGRDSAARIFSAAESEWNRRYNWQDEMRSPPVPPQQGRDAAPSSFPTLLGVLGGDRHLNWRHAILGIVVTAETYLQNAGDGSALAAASVWQGIATEERAKRADGSWTITAASPVSLVGQFHAMGPGLPEYLPVCAATTGPIRSVHEGREAAPSAPVPADAAAPTPVVPRDPGRVRFTSGTTLVTVPLTVTGRDGQTVRDLPMTAFRVFEDGVEQKVERLDAGSVPADVALLIDTSGSMRAVRDAVRASAPAIAAALRAADRAMIVSLDRRIRMLSEFTGNGAALQRAIARIGPGGGTRLYDALALVAVDRLSGLEGRKAIILLTDGVDTQSYLTDAGGALAAIEASNTPVFVVSFETADAGPLVPPGVVKRWLIASDHPEGAHEDADRFLRRLSAESGGRLLAARADADLPEMLAHIGEELSSQLVLGYYPSNTTLDGTYRRIRVTAECDGCSVRARAGYRAGVAR